MHPQLAHAIAHLLLTALSVLIVSKVLPGIRVEGYGAAVKFSFVVAILNAVAWYVLAPLTWTFAVLTLGVGALVVNGIVFLLGGRIVSGVQISGCMTAAFASLGVGLVNWGIYLFVGRWVP